MGVEYFAESCVMFLSKALQRMVIGFMPTYTGWGEAIEGEEEEGVAPFMKP